MDTLREALVGTMKEVIPKGIMARKEMDELWNSWSNETKTADNAKNWC